MSAKNKKKSSLFEKKNLLVTAMAAIFVILVALVMSMILPKEEKTSFESTAWQEAVDKAQKSLEESIENEDSGLTSVYNEETVATTAEAQPDNADSGAEGQDGSKAPNTISFALPVSGAVLKDYSGDELVYSETMQDWRTHNGIDFSAPEGTDVLAAVDGTVEAVTDSSMFGTTVIILHSGGVRTIYSNLEPGGHIEAGESVAKGAIIGKVGSSAAAEASEQPHLHFEMSLNEETVNPHDYLTLTTTEE